MQGSARVCCICYTFIYIIYIFCRPEAPVFDSFQKKKMLVPSRQCSCSSYYKSSSLTEIEIGVVRHIIIISVQRTHFLHGVVKFACVPNYPFHVRLNIGPPLVYAPPSCTSLKHPMNSLQVVQDILLHTENSVAIYLFIFIILARSLYPRPAMMRDKKKGPLHGKKSCGNEKKK
jgi:hypothetical protein